MAIYRRNPDTACRVVDGQAFIVTPNHNIMHTLNATATVLWTLAEDGCSAEEATAAIVSEYDVDEGTARRDVETCFAEMVSREILVID